MEKLPLKIDIIYLIELSIASVWDWKCIILCGDILKSYSNEDGSDEGATQVSD